MVSSQVDKHHESLYELFWKALPQYMVLGMSPEEFWHGEPRLTRAYRAAYKQKLENKYNEEWRNGYYTYVALSVALSNAFGKHSSAKYPEQPMFAVDEKEAAKEAEKRKMIEDRQRFKRFVETFNQRFNEKKSETN